MMSVMLDHLIEKLEGRDPSDRLFVMAQNPSDHHYWTLGLAAVSTLDLLNALKIAKAVSECRAYLNAGATQ